MFMFSPLPLASVVGLPAAFPTLDGFIRPSMSDTLAAAVHLDGVGFAAVGGTPRVGPVGGLYRQLVESGDGEGVLLLAEAWRHWQDSRGQVETAAQAVQERARWGARRQVADSPQARRELRSWSQQAAQLVGPATQAADRVAVAVNDAAQGVTPTQEPIRRVVPSWR